MTSKINTVKDESPSDQAEASSLDVVALPWVFTQHHPLDTNDFIRRAKDRGVDLDVLKLRQLYKQRVLVPLVVVTARRHAEPQVPAEPEPLRAGTRLYQLREARRDGRLLDLNAGPFLPRLAFTPTRPYVPGWWNGLLYSHHQLAILPRLHPLLGQTRYTYRNKKLYPRLSKPDPFLRHWAAWYHRIALMATALEARYLPVLDPDWVYLVNAEPTEHAQYRQSFDPVSMSRQLHYPADQVLRDAKELLSLAHLIEPMSGPWSQLLRRAPRDSWKHLKGEALSAMGLRETAEILLRFYEDLADAGEAAPLPDIARMAWHPLHERLSSKQQTLDQDLMDIGISPHARVVLAVEGETEEIHAPGVLVKLGPADAPELVRIMKLGGVDNNPVKVGALAATPVVIRKSEDDRFWWIMKPPTRFIVAADPEGRYYAPGKIGKTRTAILDEIRANLKVKGVKAADSELEELVELQTWDESCYEYAHFEDEELADAIAEVHTTCNGLTRNELISALRYWRGKRKDIKRVWESGRWDAQLQRPSGRWDYDVSKTKLAEALWPVLERKIEAAMSDPNAPVPPIAQVIIDALMVAQNWRYKSFVLRAVEPEP